MSSAVSMRAATRTGQQRIPQGQNPFGALGATSMVLAFVPDCAFATLTPAKAAETTNTVASAILLSIGSPCGFVVAVSTPTRRIRRVGQTLGEQPADHGGKT